MGKLRIAGFLKTSAADGPGIRSVLFFQGCGRNCPGCHNAGISRKNGGTVLDSDSLAGMLLNECRNRRLTLSGGEPLEQYPALLELSETLYGNGFDLCLYTGMEPDEVPDELLRYLHYIKTGPYIEARRTFDTPFIGSDNQRFTEL